MNLSDPPTSANARNQSSLERINNLSITENISVTHTGTRWMLPSNHFLNGRLQIVFVCSHDETGASYWQLDVQGAQTGESEGRCQNIARYSV